MKTIWTHDDQVLEPRGENVNASLKQVVKKVGARIFVSVFWREDVSEGKHCNCIMRCEEGVISVHLVM